ncbi:PAS domain-containing protein [Roseivivax lentus]|nr:PAS domain-containing protein [Roseivivax lentus]
MSGRGPDLARTALGVIESYWQALRADHGPVPPRSAVDPRGMQNALEFAFLIHHIAPGIGRMRVAGSHLNDLAGMEVAGMPLSAMFTPDARDALARGLKEVFARPAILRAELTSAAGWSRKPLTAEMLILPLTCEAGCVDRALGALVTRGEIGRTPRRFGITEMRIDTMGAAPRPASAAPARPRHFAETQAPFAARRGTGPRAPHLRVVVSND